jgi:hypothetical protein
MSEEFDSYDDFEDSPVWFWDNLTVYGYCVSWESCACGFSVLCHWPNGKKGGVITECFSCGYQNYTIAVVACLN